MKAIAAKLSRVGLAFVRIPAVDGKSLGPLPWRGFDVGRYTRRHGKRASSGEVGCYLSHVAAMQAFLAAGTSHALILEDDALFSDDFVTVIQTALAGDEAWDVLTLYGNHHAVPMVTRRLSGGKAIVAFWAQQTGSVAYLISRCAAEAYVKRMLPMSLPFDHALTRTWETGVRFRGLLPFPVTTGAVPTMISAGSKLPKRQRISTAVFRAASLAQLLAYNTLKDRVWVSAIRSLAQPPQARS